jgi:7,8-dihydroneopterin aldolase/epimerase/oxygenase
MNDLLQLCVHDLEVPVLTGIYSEETHLPQPLKISISTRLSASTRNHRSPNRKTTWT